MKKTTKDNQAKPKLTLKKEKLLRLTNDEIENVKAGAAPRGRPKDETCANGSDLKCFPG